MQDDATSADLGESLQLPTRAELAVMDFGVHPDVVFDDTSITFSANLYNVGPTAAGPFTVRFTLEKSEYYELPFPGMEPGGGEPLKWEHGPMPAGTYDVEIIADAYEQVLENSKQDNYALQTFNVATLPTAPVTQGDQTVVKPIAKLGHKKDAYRQIESMVDDMVSYVGIFWSNYRDGLLAFDQEMSKASKEEVEAALSEGALEGMLDSLIDSGADLLGEYLAPIVKALKGVVKGVAAETQKAAKSAVEEKDKEFMVTQFLDIGPSTLQAQNEVKSMADDLKIQYNILADAEPQPEDATGDYVYGITAGFLLEWEERRKKFEASVGKDGHFSPAAFMQRFTEEFAKTPGQFEHKSKLDSFMDSFEGKVPATLHFHFSVEITKDEGSDHIQSSVLRSDEAWEFLTLEKPADRLAESELVALKKQGKLPKDSAYPKKVFIEAHFKDPGADTTSVTAIVTFTDNPDHPDISAPDIVARFFPQRAEDSESLVREVWKSNAHVALDNPNLKGSND